MIRPQPIRSTVRSSFAIALVLAVAAMTSCRREERVFEDVSVAGARSIRPALSPLSPGSSTPQIPENSPFQDNAWGISEGKRLYENVNCVGCHSHGGGGMGPALMDEKWIYGSHPATIFETIVEGRPNGMPSFRGKLTDQQVWQIVAYVQAMSGQSSLPSLPGRSDHLRYSTPESNRPAEQPVQTGNP
jgi:cytochrome c oxidase cbb3-type subunit III